MEKREADQNGASKSQVDRRKFLIVGGAVGAFALAGCGGGDGSSKDKENKDNKDRKPDHK